MTATRRTTDRSDRSPRLDSLDELNDIARETQSPAWDVPIQAVSALLRSRSPTAVKPPPKPRAHHPLAAQRSRRCPPARPAARSLALPSSSLSSALQILLPSPLQSVICPTTALLHTRPSSLPHLLPVPGPDPARLPLWWLGGVRARHRTQTPIPTRVGCGHGVHSAVHAWIPDARCSVRPREQ
jgi:hypothetical protein